MELIPDERFYMNSPDTYPPFKNGLYLEEYFLEYMKATNQTTDKYGRTYIPALWTNIQVHPRFDQNIKEELQRVLDDYISKHPSATDKEYFTIVQHDDGIAFRLPPNTLIYGTSKNCDVKIPLIYEDKEERLLAAAADYAPPHEETNKYLASFVGTTTHPIRERMLSKFGDGKNNKFCMIPRHGWSPVVDTSLQRTFIETTLKSKFAFAPRGYGPTSFRFYEILKLGRVPIYVWDTEECLPYKEIIDYTKFCISIHENRLDELEQILENITPEQYQTMLDEYKKIKFMFEMDFMCDYICIGITADPKEATTR